MDLLSPLGHASRNTPLCVKIHWVKMLAFQLPRSMVRNVSDSLWCTTSVWPNLHSLCASWGLGLGPCSLRVWRTRSRRQKRQPERHSIFLVEAQATCGGQGQSCKVAKCIHAQTLRVFCMACSQGNCPTSQHHNDDDNFLHGWGSIVDTLRCGCSCCGSWVRRAGG
jgi:hypothetical protein